MSASLSFFLEREIHCEFETSRDKISWAGHISRTNGRHFHYKFHSAISDFLVFLIFLVSFSDLPDSEMAFFRRLYDFHSRFQFPPNNISIRLSARNYGQNNICWINSREQKKNKIKPRNPAAYWRCHSYRKIFGVFDFWRRGTKPYINPHIQVFWFADDAADWRSLGKSKSRKEIELPLGYCSSGPWEWIWSLGFRITDPVSVCHMINGPSLHNFWYAFGSD